jgi:hypothetical protein
MSAIRTVVNIYTRGKWTWFFLPWMVLLLQFFVSQVVMLLVRLFGGETTVYPGGLITVCVIMFLWGMMNLAETFPFALGWSCRRTDYFLGTTVITVAVSGLTAVLWLLGSLLEIATGGWGLDLSYFHLPYLTDGSLIEQFWISFVVLANMYVLGSVIGGISQRFGRTGIVLFLLVVLLLLSLFALVWTALRWWGALFQWFGQFTAFELALGLLPVTIVSALLLYALLRRAAA